jgi:site-specific DNA recombinase
MNQLDYFKKFVPAKESNVRLNFEAWSYSRVSSKEQFEQNSSVERQKEANREYALNNGLAIIEEFGGTYESAKSDFTRKEFKRLIDKVQRSRKKPYAILVYKMSRFSRSGGGAIGLVSYLVDELKVHLIEVSTGLNTTTERGKAAIWESLFHAFRENLERKEIIIPNMKAFLKAGNYLGPSPLGYDHYGPRVRDGRFLAQKQKIIVNDAGKLLGEAWQWKLTGQFSDVQILSKLSVRGLKILPQKLTKIWRNPFYCGIIVNRMVDEPVKGKWEPLVTIEQFMKVQQLLEKNSSGYQHKKDEDERPLTRLLKCDDCGGYMVGYKNNQKNLHYYRCLKCRGVSVNARTTIKSKKKGADDLFIDLLNQYQINPKLTPLIELQLTKIFDHYNAGSSDTQNQFEKQLATLQNQIKQLKIRFGMNAVDKETHDLTLEHLTLQVIEVNKELNTGKGKISNLENLISQSLKKLGNLSEIWCSSDLDGKRILHKSIFPGGIFYNVKKHQHLTRKVNSYIELVSSMSKACEGKKKGNLQSLSENSRDVARSGVEPETFGL